MVSIQSSSYGVSALVSSQMPSATKNCETGAGLNRQSGNAEIGQAEGVPAAGGPPPGTPPPVGPPPGAEKAADPTDDKGTALTLLETDENEMSSEAEAPTWDEFQAATRHHEEIVDLREEDEVDETAPDSGDVSFDEAGTYRPAWIK